ncbi:MAG TPA: leucyl/phenylalanyl-tRNA--protein transferase [Fimbriimonas sp.]
MRGDELTPWLVQYAYRQGAFPMADDEDQTIRWYQPYVRALLPIEGIHVSRSLARTIRKERFQVRFDTAFERVMRSCLRPEIEGNWISEDIIRTYTEIHHLGWAHCAECWEGESLVGGAYGIAIGSCFCAESMFHRRTDASKVALWALVRKCRELGFTMFDAQIMTEHLRSLGAFEVSHREYMKRLRTAMDRKTPWSGE